MAWFLDQPSWGQGVIYGSPLADASGSVSPFFPDIEPNLATDYEAYLNPSINDAHHLGYGHQYHTTPASIPSQWAAIASPSIPNLTNRVTNNLHSAVNQPPIVPASRHPEPKPRTRKKDLSLVIEYATVPVSPSALTNSISNCCLAHTPTLVPPRLSNASGKAAIIQVLSRGSTNLSATFGQFISRPWPITVRWKDATRSVIGMTTSYST